MGEESCKAGAFRRLEDTMSFHSAPKYFSSVSMAAATPVCMGSSPGIPFLILVLMKFFHSRLSGGLKSKSP